MVRPSALKLVRHIQYLEVVLVHDVQTQEERDVNVNDVHAQFQIPPGVGTSMEQVLMLFDTW
jgi:hypothetical protein